MRLVLIGPPGSGKGTQANLLSERLNLFHFGMGDLLREAIRLKTPAGQHAAPFVSKGQLVPDDVVNEMIAEQFDRDDRADRFVMDGYPRTIAQAKAFDVILEQHQIQLNAVIHFKVDDEEIVRRLSGRRMCTQCGSNFHVIFRKPRVEGQCDRCGGLLEQREDDTEETVRDRLQIFHANEKQLIDHYQQKGLVKKIFAENDVETVYNEIVKAASSHSS